MYRKILGALCALQICVSAAGVSAQEDSKDTLTHGQVQMNLRVGQTSQLDVVEAFGAPNITTVDGEGREVWIYRRHGTVTQSKTDSSSFGILFGAGGSNVAGGAGFGKSKTKSGFEQSTRSMVLIIKFGEDKVVADFRSRSSSF